MVRYQLVYLGLLELKKKIFAKKLICRVMRVVSTSHYEKKFTKTFWCPNILNKLFSSNPYDPLKIPSLALSYTRGTQS